MSNGSSLSLSPSLRQKGVIDVLLIALLAIVALVAAGYFLFGQSFMAPATNLFMMPVTNLSRQIQLPFTTPTAADDITSLEKEINTAEFDSIDSELVKLESELDASLTE